MIITRTSLLSGMTHSMDIPCTQEQLTKWEQGTLIQDAMPDVPAELREFVMTGITPTEWNEMFAGFDDTFIDEDDWMDDDMIV